MYALVFTGCGLRPTLGGSPSSGAGAPSPARPKSLSHSFCLPTGQAHKSARGRGSAVSPCPRCTHCCWPWPWPWWPSPASEAPARCPPTSSARTGRARAPSSTTRATPTTTTAARAPSWRWSPAPTCPSCPRTGRTSSSVVWRAAYSMVASSWRHVGARETCRTYPSPAESGSVP